MLLVASIVVEQDGQRVQHDWQRHTVMVCRGATASRKRGNLPIPGPRHRINEQDQPSPTRPHAREHSSTVDLPHGVLAKQRPHTIELLDKLETMNCGGQDRLGLRDVVLITGPRIIHRTSSALTLSACGTYVLVIFAIAEESIRSKSIRNWLAT